MDEIKIYLDKEKKNEVQDSIIFEGTVAGEVSKARVYVYNATEYPINIEMTLQGKNIKISKTITKIGAKKTEEVEFKITPKITTMKPITAKLKIKIDYIIN